MKDILKEMTSLAILASMMLIMFFAGRCSAPKSDSGKTDKRITDMSNKVNWLADELNSRIITGRKIDTIVKDVVRFRPVFRYRDTGSIIYVPDTTGQNLSFTASTERIEAGDTVNVTYEYPANVFDLRMRFRADTSKIVYRNEIVFETRYEHTPRWLQVLSHTGAALAGGLVGYAVGK